ncbi:unnamed protein product [Oikopleura dioica]|uniref:MBD domain-containing protein n=1 Tax=Oikopleura dioica TaxID=34765 RepID=E4WYY9_OIKDI|nr:unnamed protein product [Oikopleura dioica]CBY31922.1 unnamed protein product [Oikopleura dioica]CBY39896.1 unnamed protein product [Oikopleura dioica]
MTIVSGFKKDIECDGEKGRTVYRAPDGTVLRSSQDIVKYCTQTGTCKCGMPAEIKLSELTFESPVKYEKIKLSLRKLSSKWTSAKPSEKRKVQDDLKMKKTKKLKIEEICRNLSKAPEAPSPKTKVDKDNNHIPNPAQAIVSKS